MCRVCKLLISPHCPGKFYAILGLRIHSEKKYNIKINTLYLQYVNDLHRLNRFQKSSKRPPSWLWKNCFSYNGFPCNEL